VYPVVEQRILLSNGRELVTKFQDVGYSTVSPLPLIANKANQTDQVEVTGQDS
jgi:hypothetical protein